MVALGDAVEFFDVWQRKFFAVVKIDRAVACPEKTGRRLGRASPLGAGVKVHVVRHLTVHPAKLLGHHRAEVGIFQRRLVAATAQHQVRPAAVAAVLGVERAYEAGVLHPLGHLRHQLADMNTGDVGRDVGERAAGRHARLGIPSLKLARAAGQPKQDHPLVVFLERGIEAIGGEGVDRAAGAQQSGAHGTQAAKE